MTGAVNNRGQYEPALKNGTPTKGTKGSSDKRDSFSLMVWWQAASDSNLKA